MDLILPALLSLVSYLKIVSLCLGRHSGLDPESSDFVIVLLKTKTLERPFCNTESRWIPASAGMTILRQVLFIFSLSTPYCFSDEQTEDIPSVFTGVSHFVRHLLN